MLSWLVIFLLVFILWLLGVGLIDDMTLFFTLFSTGPLINVDFCCRILKNAIFQNIKKLCILAHQSYTHAKK